MSGTSMATPHVSGAAALVLSACTFSTADLKAKLLGSVDSVSSLLNKTVTGGRLNLYKAVTNCTIVPPPQQPPPTQGDFSVSASPSSATVKRGRYTTYTVKVTAIGSFNSLVTLSVSGLPANATTSFSSPTITGGGSSGMTVSTRNSIPVGSYNLAITGTSASSTRSAAVTLKVTK
jgi:subtilisin family serine protease